MMVQTKANFYISVFLVQTVPIASVCGSGSALSVYSIFLHPDPLQNYVVPDPLKIQKKQF